MTVRDACWRSACRRVLRRRLGREALATERERSHRNDRIRAGELNSSWSLNATACPARAWRGARLPRWLYRLADSVRPRLVGHARGSTLFHGALFRRSHLAGAARHTALPALAGRRAVRDVVACRSGTAMISDLS